MEATNNQIDLPQDDLIPRAWSLVLHCASLTAHNKMAAVIKSIQSNIIKMKLTEEKGY